MFVKESEGVNGQAVALSAGESPIRTGNWCAFVDPVLDLDVVEYIDLGSHDVRLPVWINRVLLAGSRSPGSVDMATFSSHR